MNTPLPPVPARLAAAWLLFASPAVAANACCDPAGPFAPGEGPVAHPATCETLAHWLDRAPDIEGRVTMVTRGELVAVGTDGVLAWLIMCEPSGVQVMCVTYSTGDFEPGAIAVFSGGYVRAGERQIMLDPCLASPAD